MEEDIKFKFNEETRLENPSLSIKADRINLGTSVSETVTPAFASIKADRINLGTSVSETVTPAFASIKADRINLGTSVSETMTSAFASITSIAPLNASLSKLSKSYIIEEINITKSGEKKKSAIVKNARTKESVPLDSLASTLSPMDIINQLTAGEVFSFYNYLSKYPLLGLNHEVGKKIFNEISNQQLIKINNLNLFRGRERDSEARPMPFSELEMFQAPYGIAGHGRFNVNGQGELYTCENREIALKEIGAINHKNKKYEVVEWKLLREVKMLDLTNVESELVKFCLFKKVSNNAQEYLLPNFLAQCAKYHGINGIKVSSTINKNYNNYVFFDFEAKWFELIDIEYNVTPN